MSPLCNAQEIDTIRIRTILQVVTWNIENEEISFEYLKLRGWCFQTLGEYEKAIKDYSLASEIKQNDPDLYIRRGEVFCQTDNYLNCIQDYSKAIELAPDSIFYRTTRGVAYIKYGNYSKALNDFNFVLNSNRKDELALMNRAILYSSYLDKFEEGITDWNSLLNISPKSSYFNDRGHALMMLQKYKEAISDFNKAIELDPNDETFYLNRGFCYGKTGRIDDAINDFTIAEKIDAKNPYIYRNRGEIYLEIGQIEIACEDFYRAAKFGLDVKKILVECKKE